ncbi:MAG: PAS domain S-box protein, partial [Armatimonadia bacterium]|nr:PAS domain S-box protein [Armatimonadia bacterium]
LGDLREPFTERLRQARPLPCLEEVAANGQFAVFEDVGTHSTDCPLVPVYLGRAAYVAPIAHGGERFGFMGVSIPASLAHDQQEQALFSEIARDLGAALSTISAAEQRQAAEAAQAAADLRYETLVETMGDGLAVCDSDGVLTYVNDAYARMVDSEPERLVGRHVLNMIADRARADAQRRLNRRLAGGATGAYESTYVTDSGDEVPVLISASPLRDEEGAVIGGFAVVKDISEIKRRESELEKLHQIIEKSPAVGIVWGEGAGWPVDFVTHAIEQFGYTREQLMSGEVMYSDLVHPDDIERLGKEVTFYIAAGADSFTQEYRIITADGEVRWIHDRTTAIRDEAGNNVGHDGVLLDITDRKRAEEALRDSEERYRLIAENTVDAIWVMDLEMNFTYANPAIEHVSGYTQDEWIGSSLADHATPEDLEFMAGQARKAIEMGAPSRGLIFESRILHKDGQPIPVEITGRAIFDEQGRPIELQGVTRDITDRKRAEAARAQNEAMLRQLLDATPDVALLLRPDGTIVAGNDVFAERIGQDPDEIVGMCIWDHLDEPVRSERREKVDSVVATGEPVQWEDHRDGRWHHNRVYPVTDADGGLSYIAVFAHDITAHREAQQALARSEERYRELVQNANDIIYTLTPDGTVTSMNGAVEKILGFTPEELEGRKLSDLLGEERHQAARAHYERKLADGEAETTYEFDILNRRGEEVVLEINTTLRYEDGEPVEIIGIARDITHRKFAEEELARSEESYRNIFDAVNEALIVHDIETGAVVDVNETMREMYRVADAPVGDLTVEDLSFGEAPYDGEHAATLLAKAAQGEPQVFEWRARDRDGEPFWVEVSLKKATIAGHERVVAVVRDITDRKRADQELRERVKEMRCLYHVASLSEHHERPLEQVLQSVADILPVSWRWPAITTAVVEFDGDIYEAGGAEGPPTASQTAGITVRGEAVGRIEVRYHEERPEADEGPFLNEERDLLDTVATTVGDMIRHRRAQSERDTLARFPDENPMAVMRVGEDGVVDYANASAAELLGQLGSGVGDLAPVGWRETLDRSLRSGHLRRLEVASGRRHFTISAAPVPDLGYVNLYGMDVTERHQAEQALLESEQRFRRAIAQAPFPIMLHAEGGDVLTVNGVWTDITGYAPEELSTIEEWTERAYGERMTQVVEEIDHLYELDRAIDEGEYEIRTAAGATRIWHFHSAPLGELLDGRRLVISMAADITARRAAQEALRESERRYRTVFENTGAATCLIGPDGTILLA